MWPFRYHKPERNQLARVIGPTVLDRQVGKVDVILFDDHFLARWIVIDERIDVGQSAEFGQAAKRITDVIRQLWRL